MCLLLMTQFSMQNQKNFNELVENFQGFVSTLFNWLNTKKLVAHESKTKLMLFTPRIHPVLHDIRFNHNTPEWVSHIKYLGILLLLLLVCLKQCESSKKAGREERGHEGEKSQTRPN